MDLALSNREADAREGSTKLKSMREEFECYLRDQLDGVTMIKRPRSPSETICVAFEGVNRQALMMAADLQGIAIATGSACASGSSEPSPVLLAMGLPEELVSVGSN